MATVSLDMLRDLMGHMEWADAGMWRALLAHSPAVHDARLRDLLLHLHAVQRAFLAIWTGRPLDRYAVQGVGADQRSAHAAVQACRVDCGSALG